MSIFGFAPQRTTITTTVTPQLEGSLPSPTTFTYDPGAAPTDAFSFPFLPLFLPNAPENGCDPRGNSIPRGPGGMGIPGQGKQGGPGGGPCRPSASPTANEPSQSPPPLPSTQSTSESTEPTSSQSSPESDSTPTNYSTTSTGSPSQASPSSASTDPPQGGSITTSYHTSSISTTSFYPGIPSTNLPIPPTQTQTLTEFSSATASAQPRAESLTAGSAVGIALGVFAGASVLAAAALFLFLRERKRRRYRDSITQKLRPESEGAPSRVLSSTWSWFGSLAIGLEPDPDPKHAYAHDTRPSLDPHDSDLGDRTRADRTTLTFGEHGARDPFADPRLLGSENGRTSRMSMASPGKEERGMRSVSER